MQIYYKENTGIKTKQDENCDYFAIEDLGLTNFFTQARGVVHFWEKLEHAQAGKPANAMRILIWDNVANPDPQSGLNYLFQEASHVTTSLDTISLQNPTPINAPSGARMASPTNTRKKMNFFRRIGEALKKIRIKF